MNRLLIVCVCAILIFQSCKKDDDSGGAGVVATSRITPTTPPLGFSFPRTYRPTSTTVSFQVWINNIDRTSSFKPSYFFSTDQDPFVNLNFKLLDKNKIQAIDLSGQTPPEEANYYFYRDTLYIIDRDTFAFAKGNYYGFSFTLGSYKISGEGHGAYLYPSGTDDHAVTKQQVLDRYSSDFNRIDTLVIYNRLIQFN